MAQIAAQAKVTTVPLTLPRANDLVKLLHRHHAPIPGGFGWFCVGAVTDGLLVGCAIAGRPTNRNNDDGQTVEVLRVATDGTPNAPSALLGACAKAARAIGARRIITYTLDSESGVSLRGAGWRREADGIESWWTHPGKDGNGRVPAVDRPHMAERKVRWGVTFRPDVVPYSAPCVDKLDDEQLGLFDERPSVDEERRHGLPVNPAVSSGDSLTSLVVPVEQVDALTVDHDNEPILTIDSDTQAHESTEEVVGISVSPFEVHSGDSTATGGAA